jgi:hypothetical protein
VFEHDLFGKPIPIFPERALIGIPRQGPACADKSASPPQGDADRAQSEQPQANDETENSFAARAEIAVETGLKDRFGRDNIADDDS